MRRSASPAAVATAMATVRSVTSVRIIVRNKPHIRHFSKALQQFLALRARGREPPEEVLGDSGEERGAAGDFNARMILDHDLDPDHVPGLGTQKIAYRLREAGALRILLAVEQIDPGKEPVALLGRMMFSTEMKSAPRQAFRQGMKAKSKAFSKAW